MMVGSRDESPHEQAAAWLVRLHNRAVSTDDLDAFALWRREPGNADAYARAERLWNASQRLTGDPDIHAALHGAGLNSEDRTGAQILSRPALMVATVAAVIALAVGMMSFRAAVPATTYQTAVGERSHVQLADGSALQLDTDSEVTARFSLEERRITLKRGQAFFRVAHDADKPFVVDTGNGLTVTATGTQFDVKRGTGIVRVALIEGGVVVRRGDSEVARLTPGAVIDVPIAGDAARSAHGTTGDATRWRDGHLSFHATPLVEAVAEMNRYTDIKMTIRDAQAREEPISGEFSVNDTAGFVRAVDTLFGENTVGP